MGTSLTGLTPSTTYDALIKVGDNGPLSATAKYLSDGLGNDSVLALSTARVGIGTASPDLTLHLYSAAAALSYFESTNANGAYVIWRNSGTSIGDVGSQLGISGTGSASNFMIASRSGDLILGSSSAERMRITSAGDVGIGTSNPQGKLHVSSTGDTYFVLTGGSTPLSYSFLVDANDLRLFTGVGSSEKLRVTSSYLRMASGTGGIQFNGDTAAANALDDYEEGTWTPVFSGTTFSGAIGATYTKIGRVVNVQMNFVNQTLSSSSGTAAISGLPFTCNSVTFGMVNFTFCDSLTASVATGYVGVSGTSIQIRTNTGISDTTFIDGTSNKSMMLSATYFV
jgi:hypothetical protein